MLETSITVLGEKMKNAIFLLSLFFCRMLSALKCTNITPLSDSAGVHYGSKVAVNENDSAAIVAWIKSNGQGSSILQAAVRPDRNPKWNSPHFISEPMNIEAFVPFVKGMGDTCVFWNAKNQDDERWYYFSHKEQSGQWSQSCSVLFKDYPTIRDMNFDKQGNPFVIVSPEDESVIVSRHYKPNEAPRSIANGQNDPLVTTVPKQVNAPLIVKNKRGDIAAVWVVQNDYKEIAEVGTLYHSYKDKTDFQFATAHYRGDDEWGEPTTIPLNMGFKDKKEDKAKDISASMNNGKNLAILWSLYIEEDKKHTLKSIVQSDSPKLQDIASKDDGFKESSIIIDDDDNTVAIWIQTDKGINVVYAAYKPKGKNWQGTPKPLSDPTRNAKQVEISSFKGKFVVIWGESSNDMHVNNSIHGTTLSTASFEWAQAEQLSLPDESCCYPSMAFSEENGFITWTKQIRYKPDFQIQVANLMVD
jgi:hypothetical protein